jgi:hypothetical protein
MDGKQEKQAQKLAQDAKEGLIILAVILKI